MSTVCKRCGEPMARMRGLQGPAEVLTFILLFPLCFLPAIIYYVAQEARPYCSKCARRG